MDTFEYLNIQYPEGRRVALCNILALLRWHDAGEAEEGDVIMEDVD